MGANVLVGARVSVGVDVVVDLGVDVGLGVFVGLAVCVGAAVLVGIGVTVGVLVGVAVGANVDVFVGRGVLVGTGVGSGEGVVHPTTTNMTMVTEKSFLRMADSLLRIGFLAGVFSVSPLGGSAPPRPHYEDGATLAQSARKLLTPTSVSGWVSAFFITP